MGWHGYEIMGGDDPQDFKDYIGAMLDIDICDDSDQFLEKLRGNERKIERIVFDRSWSRPFLWYFDVEAAGWLALEANLDLSKRFWEVVLGAVEEEEKHEQHWNDSSKRKKVLDDFRSRIEAAHKVAKGPTSKRRRRRKTAKGPVKRMKRRNKIKE